MRMKTNPFVAVGTCSLCHRTLYRHNGWINNPVVLEDGTKHTHDRPFRIEPAPVEHTPEETP